ncbi:Tetratricopeptide repeat [Novymonas esmeraldas]|uniref:Tetratricopeptide repeat n=1 Tax=Novymonas esmeraldas TaxID=1808958 RepID=A0AAW0FCY5_9TRYP
MTDTLLRTHYALLLFYVREKYWRHAEDVCVSTMQTTDDSMFRVWRALTLERQGMPNDALREYKAVETRRGTAVPALMGMQLIYRHNRDQEGVAQTEARLDSLDVSGHLGGWLQAAALCWAAGDSNGARDILLKVADVEGAATYRDEYTNYGAIRAWVDLLSGRGALLEKAGALFASVLEAEEAQYSYFQAGGGGGDGATNQSSGSGGAGGGKWTDMNAALGYVAYLERKTQLGKAQSLLDRLAVLYPSCSIPPLVGKARLLMHAEDWEQAIEVTRRILARDNDNVEALTLEALYALVKDTRHDAATVRLRRLLDAVRAKEPRNVALHHQFGLVFSRLAGDRLDLLSLTSQFSEAACELESRNGDVLCGLGYQQLYRHDYAAATATFRKAATLTDSLAPLLGTVTCLLRLNNVAEAATQLDFCNQLQPASQRNAELCFLNAQLRWHLRGAEEETAVLRYLDQATEAIKHDVTALAGTGMEAYVQLNAPVALGIARAYLMHCRNEPPDPLFKRVDVVGEKCSRHLEFLVQHLPACMEAQLMLAKVWFVTGEVRKAQALLKGTLLVQEQPLPEAFLLSSQICQYTGDVKLASRALEQALTLDFAMQEQPLYNLLLGTVQGTTGKSAESLASLQRAYDTVKSSSSSSGSGSRTGGGGGAAATGAGATSTSGKPMQQLSVPESVTLYLQLAQAQLRVRDVDAARATLTEAAQKYRDSTQAGRVAIAQAMLAARTDVDKSIELLRQVPSRSEFYIAAHSQLGKLFLTQKRNVAMYIQCFQEMAEAVQSAQSYVELGEAYTTIQEPEQAIAAYEKAKALSPSSGAISIRVGRALVAAHDYAKAIRYYQDALSSDPYLATVRADLATLQWRLGRIDAARETITQSPAYETPPSDAADESIAAATERVNLYLLLYKLLRDQPWTVSLTAHGSVDSSDHGDAALAALRTARSLQQRLMDQQLRTETAEVVAEQRIVMAGICAELGVRCAHSRPAPQPASADKKAEAAAALALQSVTAARLTLARDYLREAITYDESSERAQLESARLCHRNADVDGCERHCTTVLRMAGGSAAAEEAAMLLANLYTQQGRPDDARAVFETLLGDTPQQYEALVDYLVLLHHAGQLEDGRAAIDRAAAAAVPTGQRADPGLSYARGLFEYLSNNKAEALRHFNVARLPADNAWCARALAHMVRIYLVPTTQDLWVLSHQVTEPSAASPLGAQQQQRKSMSSNKPPSTVASPMNTSTVAAAAAAAAEAAAAAAAAVGAGGGELHDNLRYAEQLLLLLPVHSEERRILQAYCTLATRRPAEVETAMHLFLECIVAAEAGGGVGKPQQQQPPAVVAGGGSVAPTPTTTPPVRPVGTSDSDDDEDLQLLAGMHEAAAQLAQRSSGMNTATLAFALQCTVVHPAAFLGLSMSLYVSGQETAARNVLARLLESKSVKTTVPAAAAAAAAAAAGGSAAGATGSASAAALSESSDKSKTGSAAATGATAAAAAPAQIVVPPPTALLTCSEDDTLQRAMLLQAHMDMHANQLDDARFVLRQVLAANQGCGAAWDTLGIIYERQQKHKEASRCYQRAWELVKEADPAVGYKLGFNYLRGSAPVKAIDVCKRVLAHHATYPRIAEDVMDVAYTMLRP